jgi:SAM-dependent methyltransferase
MTTQNALKELVKEKYGEIALQDKTVNSTSCCGSGSCCTDVLMADDYSKLEGYVEDADLGLGCGLPTEFAKIKKGDVVIDLGSGAGNDAFIAANETGPEGKVIGIDFTPAMIEKARYNAAVRGVQHVEFIQGDIENMPIPSTIADVIVSNCVLNLVPDKNAVIKEMFRVLKFGGHFSISDIVLEGTLPASIREAAEMYAGCVSGAISKTEYLGLIEKNGFTNISIQKEKRINLPDEILANYLSPAAIKDYHHSGAGVYSITVYAEKAKASCCKPGAGCC